MKAQEDQVVEGGALVLERVISMGGPGAGREGPAVGEDEEEEGEAV